MPGHRDARERQHLTLQSKVCPPIRRIHFLHCFCWDGDIQIRRMQPGLCELGDLSMQSRVVRSKGLDLFRFMGQSPRQHRHSLFERSVLFRVALSVVVHCESAYRYSTQITALNCGNKCAASPASPSCSVSFLICDFCSVICQSTYETQTAFHAL